MVKTIAIKGFADYVRHVDKILDTWGYSSGWVWYRGVARLSYPLLPRIRRKKIGDEDSLVQDFIINYQGIHGQRLDDNWEMYALMQHYGLPTRLLDWTKSPLVALYFALEEEDPESGGRVVWVMDPCEFNEISHNLRAVIVPTDVTSISPNRLDYMHYLPKSMRVPTAGTPVPGPPLAIEPPLANKRILYQQGCFTVHGTDNIPIDTYYRKKKSSRIARFVIRGKKRRREMLKTLDNLGFKEDYIYQDLSSLSQRLAREAEAE